MPPTTPRYLPATAVLLLALASTTFAHGHSHDVQVSEVVNENATVTEPESYSQLRDFGGMMFAHVALMTVAWVFVLPIGVVLSIARSRRSVLFQFAFLCINALGLIFGTIYNASTPDMYPNNAHHKLGWVITWIAVAQGFMALINTYGGRWEAKKNQEEEESAAFIPVSAEAMAEHHLHLNGYVSQRLSGDSGQGTERNTESLLSHSTSPSLEQNQFNIPGDLRRDFEFPSRTEKVHRRSRLEQYLSTKLSGLSRFRILGVFDVLYNVVDRVILILAFVAYLTGLITWSGICKGSGIFNGLAHFIKGGIFFWYGILTLGRWAGCFADLGWAWNMKPTSSLVGPRKAKAPTAEFVESFLFFLYGSTNVFLEHLAAWGSAWTAMDLEHLGITILAMGGGLLGMLIESPSILRLLTTFHPTPPPYTHIKSPSPFTPPPTHKTSTNPLPALIVLTLGLIMSSHTQETTISTHIHAQWGTLLCIAALSRSLTHLLYFLKPPTSYLPGRPPTEVITAFSLMAGGLIFMCSAREVVGVLGGWGVGPMFLLVVGIGGVLVGMAWVVGVLAVRGWVLRGERTSRAGAPSLGWGKEVDEEV